MASFNSAAYAQSQIDWDELRKLAKEVAIKSKVPRDTVEVIEYETESYLLIFSRKKEIIRKAQVDHWVLTKYSVKEHKNEATRGSVYYYCLGVDGELFLMEEGTVYWKHLDKYILTKNEAEPRKSVMTERDVLKLDYESKRNYKEFPNGDWFEEENIPSDELIVSKKGMGLVSLLNKLI